MACTEVAVLDLVSGARFVAELESIVDYKEVFFVKSGKEEKKPASANNKRKRFWMLKDVT